MIFRSHRLVINLGSVYRAMGQLHDAARAYRRVPHRCCGGSRKRSATTEVEQMLALAEQNLGNVLVDLGQYDDALRHLRAAERIRRQLGLEAQVAMTLGNIGLLFFQRGELRTIAARRSPRRARIYDVAGRRVAERA